MSRKAKILKILTVLVIALIWVNSLIPSVLSGSESLWWAKTFNSGFAAMGIPFQFDGDAVLRKLAHATEYALLGVMAALYFHESGKLLKSCGRHHLLYIGFTAAFLDETIQLFVPGRSGQIADVWIDLAGFLPAMGIVMLVTKKKGTD
jgi:VanZ family protein